MLDFDQADEWAATLKALAHPTRLQIALELLNGTKCVTDMEEILPASQANISQHLSVLRHAKLVDFAQDGALRCYYLCRPDLVAGMLSLLTLDHPPIKKRKEDILREKALSSSFGGV